MLELTKDVNSGFESISFTSCYIGRLLRKGEMWCIRSPAVRVWARVPRSGVIVTGVRVWVCVRHVLAVVLLL